MSWAICSFAVATKKKASHACFAKGMCFDERQLSDFGHCRAAGQEYLSERNDRVNDTSTCSRRSCKRGSCPMTRWPLDFSTPCPVWKYLTWRLTTHRLVHVGVVASGPCRCKSTYWISLALSAWTAISLKRLQLHSAGGYFQACPYLCFHFWILRYHRVCPLDYVFSRILVMCFRG